MLARLLLLLIVVPLVELTLLLLLAQYTDWWVSVLLVIVSGVVGANLARQQGLLVLRRVQRELGQGIMPADALLDGLLILIAGALLLTPGMLTDALGLSMLVAPLRQRYKRSLIQWFRRHFEITTFTSTQPVHGERSDVIDSYVVDRSDTPEQQ